MYLSNKFSFGEFCEWTFPRLLLTILSSTISEVSLAKSFYNHLDFDIKIKGTSIAYNLVRKIKKKMKMIEKGLHGFPIWWKRIFLQAFVLSPNTGYIAALRLQKWISLEQCEQIWQTELCLVCQIGLVLKSKNADNSRTNMVNRNEELSEESRSIMPKRI